jgi:hypothetical protein
MIFSAEVWPDKREFELLSVLQDIETYTTLPAPLRRERTSHRDRRRRDCLPRTTGRAVEALLSASGLSQLPVVPPWRLVAATALPSALGRWIPPVSDPRSLFARFRQDIRLPLQCSDELRLRPPFRPTTFLNRAVVLRKPQLPHALFVTRATLWRHAVYHPDCVPDKMQQAAELSPRPVGRAEGALASLAPKGTVQFGKARCSTN